MKKKGLIAAMLLLFAAAAAYAQPRAIGARFSDGFEASYQHSLSSSNMVTVDFGLQAYGANPGVEAAATYDWIFPINSWQNKGTWNWYAGVGAGVGYQNGGWGYVGVAGRIGVEYNFWFPLNLFFDYRPIIGIDFGHEYVGFNTNGLFNGVTFALGARYIF